MTTVDSHTSKPKASVAFPRLWAGLADPATYRTSFHLVSDLVVGTATFTVMVSMLALSGGLIVTLVGIPLLVATLFLARGIAVVERKRAGAVLGVHVEAPPHVGRSLRDRLLDPADWRAVLYGLVLFPAGVVNATVTIAGWATAAAAIASPLYAGPVGGSVTHVGRLDLDGPVAAVGTVVLGVVLLFAMPAIVRLLARLDEVMVRRLLG